MVKLFNHCVISCEIGRLPIETNLISIILLCHPQHEPVKVPSIAFSSTEYTQLAYRASIIQGYSQPSRTYSSTNHSNPNQLTSGNQACYLRHHRPTIAQLSSISAPVLVWVSLIRLSPCDSRIPSREVNFMDFCTFPFFRRDKNYILWA
jgi:hypothetical protein